MEEIPFIAGTPRQRLELRIGGSQLIITSRWNERDHGGAHYLDFFDVDEQPIVRGVKVVLGAFLAQGCAHEWFQRNKVMAYDRSRSARDAGVDDLGGRIAVLVLSPADLVVLTSPPITQRRTST